MQERLGTHYPVTAENVSNKCDRRRAGDKDGHLQPKKTPRSLSIPNHQESQALQILKGFFFTLTKILKQEILDPAINTVDLKKIILLS